MVALVLHKLIMRTEEATSKTNCTIAQFPCRRELMKSQTTAVKSNNKAYVDSPVDEQVMKVGAAALGLFSCTVGLWAAACFVSGLLVSGGPVSLAVAWFNAVTGIS